jgi:hypothetical protein
MHEHDEQPERHQQDRHDARHPLDRGTEQLLADLDERDREADVGEHHGVPHAFEVHLLDGLESRDERYAEEPEGEGPEETGGLLACACIF